jgi:heavy metal sensor kinase
VAFAFLIYYAAAATFHQRQDESLLSTAQTVASAYIEEFAEQKSSTRAGEVVLAELTFPNRYVQLTDDNGLSLASTKSGPGAAGPIPLATLVQAKQRGSGFVSLNGWRVAIVPITANPDLGFATVAEPLSVIDDGLRTLRRDFFAGVPIILLLASAGGYFLARKSLSPIASMNRQTKRISAGRLSSRLDVTNPRDELGSLAITINDLLSRLERSFREQQRFIADASHELRTPLAVLRSETEVALNKTRTVEEYQDSLSLINDEAERLSRIVEDLFILARQPLDAPHSLIKEPVLLNDAVRDCVRAAQVLASRKGVRLETESDQQSLVLHGDGELIKRMILNLLDNAVKYTPKDGRISISLLRENGNAEIIVRDTGIGIPKADQSHVFDRFYRVDKARSRSLGGAGLGLSIVSWIVAAHSGRISVESAPNQGSTFTVELPLKLTH